MVGDNQGESRVPSCFPACTWGHACQHSVACHSDSSMLVTVSWFCHVAQKTSAELSWHGNVSTANFFCSLSFVASHVTDAKFTFLFLSFFRFHFFSSSFFPHFLSQFRFCFLRAAWQCHIADSRSQELDECCCADRQGVLRCFHKG